MFEILLQNASLEALILLIILIIRYLILKSKAVTPPGDQSGNIQKGGGYKRFTEVTILFDHKEKVD